MRSVLAGGTDAARCRALPFDITDDQPAEVGGPAAALVAGLGVQVLHVVSVQFEGDGAASGTGGPIWHGGMVAVLLVVYRLRCGSEAV